MSDELFLNGKTYVSSKRAAASTGYAQDYIGQLARKGLIDSQRVGGLWYVFPGSLEAYKRNTDALPAPVMPVRTASTVDTIVSFDGKDYVSSARAAKLTGYNPDYVGQLARAGKVLSRQVGNRWYIERDGLLAHKAQKDAMLASVQAESAGLVIAQPAAPVRPEEAYTPQLTYIREDAQLFPALAKPIDDTPKPVSTPVPIQVIRTPIPRAVNLMPPSVPQRRSASSGKAISRGVKMVSALTVVVVLSYGLLSLRSGGTYAALPQISLENVSQNGAAASAYAAYEELIVFIEKLVTEELRYTRGF